MTNGPRSIQHASKAASDSTNQSQEAERKTITKFHSLKLLVRKNKKLLVHFASANERAKCLKAILNAQGFQDQLDQYEGAEEGRNLQIADGSSRVFQARQFTTYQKVAIKVKKIAAKSSIDELPEVTLLRELKGSKNILNLIESFSQDEHTYFVYPSMPAGDLLSTLAQTKVCFLTESELRYGAFQVLEAICEVHNVGYVHNQVQASHIFLRQIQGAKNMGKRFEVKLGGFSKASLLRTTSSRSALDGSQARELNEESKANDILQLGETLFWLASGRKLPSEGSSGAGAATVPWHLVTRTQKVSEEFVELISAMFQRDARARPSASQLLSFAWFTLDQQSAVSAE